MSETKELILNTALELFRKHGYEDTTMRMIAKEAGLSLGSTYYYFSSKEALVYEFYAQTGDDAESYNQEIINSTKNISKRLEEIFQYKFKQLAPYRNLVTILVKNAASIHEPLSPFSKETKAVRDQAIRIIQDGIDGSNLKASKKLEPYLAKIFWIFQMGILFYWANDNSAKQKNTTVLLQQSLKLITLLLKASQLPLMKPVNTLIINIIHTIEGCKK